MTDSPGRPLTWQTLNPYLMTLDEAGVVALLAEERAGENRPRFLRRMHSRLNRLRAHREREEIGRG